jgi:S-adenosylmethionine:tRNA ribosyltransferase-isomerase
LIDVVDHFTLTRGDEFAIRKSELSFYLPPELIAQRPCEPRDAARLMVVDRASGGIVHRIFHDLPELLRAGDCLITNQTRVVPARFVARRATGGRIPGLFVREVGPGAWVVMLTGAGKLKIGEALSFEGGPWRMTLVERLQRGECRVEVSPVQPAVEILEQIGLTPLPPYIRRDEGDRELDLEDRREYQTVYAKDAGSVAAPTAGLHFTEELLERLERMGVEVVSLTLHVGLGTFQPVEVDDLADHAMHSEWYELPERTVELARRTRADGGRIVAVGTTATRVLETCVDSEAAGAKVALREGKGWTNILIQPPYQFRAIDALITNFHLPETTLLALVCAFAGRELVMQAYEEAIGRGYRFYSYGDAMLIV